MLSWRPFRTRKGQLPQLFARTLLRSMALMLLLALVSCARGAGDARPGGENPSPVATYDGRWELVEGRTPTGPIDTSRGSGISLTIEGESWRGVSACNQYDAQATIKGTSVSIACCGGTLMGCGRRLTTTEVQYRSALRTVDTIGRTANSLTLSGADVRLAFGFVSQAD
jgi:heat shock protein HslJ